MTPMMGAAEVRAAVASRQLSAVEVCREALDRIAALDPGLNAFRTTTAERALARAAALDARDDLHALPLAGVPIAIKDNICTKGVETTAGSRILEGYRPPYDATVVARLEAAGAIVVGKTNCDEFAMGSSTENSAYGPTRHPRALDRTPGGSSGGSAAAVAAGMVPLALGSDTGGSIRQPAGFCGITGFKPTYGRVSRYGLLAFASSLDQIGPMARDVTDAALTFKVLAGHDPRDSTSIADRAPDAVRHAGLDGLKVGVPRHLLDGPGVESDVLAAFDVAVRAMQTAGATIVEIALPHASHGVPVYYILATAEASANLARYDGVRFGSRADDAGSLDEMYARTRGERFGPEVKRRIVLGTYVLSAGYYDAYYRKAQQVRTLLGRDYAHAFGQVDVITCPTSPTTAFPLGARTADPLQMYLSDVFTVGANLAGLPAVSVPCGVSSSQLPIGLQFIGPAMADTLVLDVAGAFERAAPWNGAA
ncbi:Asp-tRNA(Asn)/Glu-tRNA(Gln) amidotransferase subunit GatA [soil metagenome]